MIRRSWFIFAGTFFALGLISVLRLFGPGARPLDAAITALIVIVGFAAVRNRLAVQELEQSRRAEAESFARILQGLSRSISPDAIVGAIVEELGAGTGADHVVIVRRRPDARVLEAMLVNARTGGSTSSTLFPITDLEDPPDADTDREPIAVPVAVDGSAGAMATAGPAADVLGGRSARPRRPPRRSTGSGRAGAPEPAGDPGRGGRSGAATGRRAHRA